MTANTASWLGILFVALTGVSFYAGLTVQRLRPLLICVPVFLFFRMMMNALDGMLSREYSTATVSGEIFNEAMDIIGDMVCYGSLLFVPGDHTPSTVVFLVLCWAAEFFGVLGKGMPNGIRRHETFMGGKPDRAAWMGMLAVLLIVFPEFRRYMGLYIGVASLFVFVTCVIRVRKTIEAAKGRAYTSFTPVGR